MVHLTSANSIITTSMEKESTLGLTTDTMKENGGAIKCTEKVLSHGVMDASTLVNMLKIRKEVTENSSGQTEDATEESGLMVSNTAKVPTLLHRDKKNMVSGKMEKE